MAVKGHTGDVISANKSPTAQLKGILAPSRLQHSGKFWTILKIRLINGHSLGSTGFGSWAWRIFIRSRHRFKNILSDSDKLWDGFSFFFLLLLLFFLLLLLYFLFFFILFFLLKTLSDSFFILYLVPLLFFFFEMESIKLEMTAYAYHLSISQMAFYVDSLGAILRQFRGSLSAIRDRTRRDKVNVQTTIHSILDRGQKETRTGQELAKNLNIMKNGWRRNGRESFHVHLPNSFASVGIICILQWIGNWKVAFEIDFHWHSLFSSTKFASQRWVIVAVTWFVTLEFSRVGVTPSATPLNKSLTIWNITDISNELQAGKVLVINQTVSAGITALFDSQTK